MPDLIDQLIPPVNNSQNGNFYRYLGVIFVIFVFLGMGIGFLVNKYLSATPKEIQTEEVAPKEEFYEGTITFIDPNLNLDDEISFVLVDKSGDDVILLKAKDQKLEVAEGHYATVYGALRKTLGTKKDYLLVDRIVIKNVSN